MNYIPLADYGKPSIRAVQSLMDEQCDIVYTHRHIPRFNKDDLIIRWGCQTQVNSNHAKIINLAKAQSLASNKAKSRMKMQEEGISVPRSAIDANNIGRTINYPLIIRTNHHHKGQNFIIVNNDREYWNWINTPTRIPNNNYFSEIINKTNEYRVHVGHGKVLLIHEKPLLEGEIRANQAVTGLSWGNVLPWEQYRRKLCKLACDAVKCIGLDMGAVDIIKDAQNNYYVLEVNTAPTLQDSPYSCQRYAKYFDWIIRHRGGVWFDYIQWRAGSSYAWKENHFNS